MRFKEKRKKNIQLDITPIVDMVFNLLIFFALSINFTSAASINLVLPKVATPDVAPHVPVIQINKDHEISIDRVFIPYTELARELIGLHSFSPNPAIIIMADETVDHGYVVSVMDSCRQAGFEKISISAQFK